MKCTCIPIFSKIGLVDQSKREHKFICKIIACCINLQLPIAIKKKVNSFRHASSQNVHVYQFSAKSGKKINHNRAHKFVREKSQVA